MGIDQIKISSVRGTSSENFDKKGGLLAKRYNLNDTGVSSVNFHYWKLKGFFHTIEDNKKASLNLIEFVWIKILMTLKKFGCSSKTMELVFDSLFTEAYSQNLAKKFRDENIAFYEKLKSIRDLTDDEQLNLTTLLQVSSDPLLSDYYSRDISYLYHMIIEILESNAYAGIKITEDGTCERFIEYPESKNKAMELTHPQIIVPISHYLEAFFVNEENLNAFNETGIITDNELFVIKEMRKNNVRSLKIFFKSDDHEIEKIEIEEKGLLSKEKSKDIIRLMSMKNYSKIELNTRDGQQLSFTRLSKKYF